MANTTLRAKYNKVIRKLFPRGYAWDRVNDQSSNIYKLNNAYANEVCRIDERAYQLIEEVDPRTTVELLLDWERLLNLPDECDSGAEQTIQERRDRVVQVLTTRGGQNEQFYKDLASNFGIEADVVSAEDQPPFLAGQARCGDRLTNGPWKYTFIIKAPASFLTPFRVGKGRTGDRLVEVGNEVLECLMNKHKPAHTIVLFSFGTDEF